MSKQLAIDRIRCDGRGMCAELLPELISLDDWGYPVIASGRVPDQLSAFEQTPPASEHLQQHRRNPWHQAPPVPVTRQPPHVRGQHRCCSLDCMGRRQRLL